MLPAPTISIEQWDTIKEDYFPIYEEFYNLLSKNEKEQLEIIDGNKFYVSLITFFNQYIRLLKKNNFNEKIGFRFKIVNSWRTLLFFDNEKYLDFIKKHECPICLKSEVEMPQFVNGNLLYLLDEEEVSVPFKDTLKMNFEINPIFLEMVLYEAFGIPRYHLPEINGGIGAYIARHSIKRDE